MNPAKSLHDLPAASDYDPESMPVEKAREYIRAFLLPVTAIERLNIRAALGRVLAEDMISPVNVPQHDNSAMDGYAVRFADMKPDGETTLKVIGTSLAGKPFEGTVGPGQAVRIMTGAVIPAGADTVIQQERTAAFSTELQYDGGGARILKRRLAGGINDGDSVNCAENPNACLNEQTLDIAELYEQVSPYAPGTCDQSGALNPQSANACPASDSADSAEQAANATGHCTKATTSATASRMPVGSAPSG